MKIFGQYRGKGLTRGKGLMTLLAVLLIALLIAAACGEAATATPEAMEEEPTAMPEPTAMADDPDDAMEPTAMPDEPDDAMPEPTATTEAMEETGLRPRSEWTVENPATREEIEEELKKYQGQSLVFSSWGGAYQSAQRQAYGIPFEERFGIEVIDDSQPTVGRVRAMQESGNVAWHVFDTGGGSIHALANGGSLEELDFSVIDTRDFLEVLKAPYIGGGGITWSETWAYNSDIYPEGSQPQNMADIYDTEKFPGRRAWNQFPDAEIVFVLLAENPDLVNSAEGRASLSAPNEEQVDRAFELFEEFRDHPDIFWTTGSDCPQFLISGEADMCTNWNGRIFDAAKEGAPLKICWECGHVLNTDGWGIIKGLKDQDPEAFELAQLYMAWTSFPEINSRMAQFITYGPVNTKALAALSDPIYDEVRDELPSSPTNIPFAIINNEVHRAANLDAWRERYEAWKGTLN